MAWGTKLTSKGFLDKALSLVAKGWLRIRDGEAPPTPTPTWCDYPHAVKMATMGRLGATVGTASRGVVLRICIEEEPIPPEVGEAGVSAAGKKKRGKPQKKIKISVWAYGEIYKAEFIVDEDLKVSAKDVEIIDSGKEIISVKLKNVRTS